METDDYQLCTQLSGAYVQGPVAQSKTQAIGNCLVTTPKFYQVYTLDSWATILRAIRCVRSKSRSKSLDFVSGNIEILGKQNSLFPKGSVIKWFVI